MAPRKARGVRLVLVQTDHTPPSGMTPGQTFELALEGHGVATIGRAPDSDLVVLSPTVGRRVVSLRLTPGGVHIRDLGSGGGSALSSGGRLYDRPDQLMPTKCALRIGQVVFQATVLYDDRGAPP